MKKVLLSGMIGNALEWYDYALYAQFAATISHHFFPPSDDKMTAIFSTFGVFAAGFLVRPLGAILFGYVGDRYGRKNALSLAILMMAIPTACIGILPSYESIGIYAPILLTLIRFAQGLSLGGEFSGCIAYVVEFSSKENRGLSGSTSFVSMCTGILAGSLVAAFTSYIFNQEDLISYGWRIPFLFGILIGGVGLYIRLSLDESPIYQEAKINNSLSKSPLKELFTSNRKELFVAIGLYLTVTIPFYTLTVFNFNYMQIELGYSAFDSLLVNSVSLIIMIIVLPISAAVSDKVGRRKVLYIGTLMMLSLSIPIFWLMSSPGFLPIVGQIIFSVITALYMGPVPTTLVELFPTRIRFTAVALSYNISAGLFGGTAPIVGFYIVQKAGSVQLMGIYIMAFAFITLFSLKYFTETYKRDID